MENFIIALMQRKAYDYRMTLESVRGQRYNGQPLPTQKRSLEVPHAADNKRVLKIGSIFETMLDAAINSPTLMPMPGNMEPGLTDELFRTNRDMPDYVRTALFADKMFVQVTMADEKDLVRTLHTLEIVRHDVISDEPDTYQISPLRIERGAERPDERYMEGVDQIAAGVDDMFEFGQIVRAYKIEARGGWKHAISLDEVTAARLALQRKLYLS